MYGRYGGDQLSIALIVLSILLQGILSLTPFGFLYVLTLIPLGFAVYRTFSRKIDKRLRENEKFMAKVGPVIFKIKRKYHDMDRNRAYKVFRCKNCKQKLRVPRGRGKINVTCPKCGKVTRKKT